MRALTGSGGNAGYDIVLLAGQSNMAGRGAFSAGIDTTDPKVFQFDGNAASGTYRTIITAIDPLKHPEPTNTNVGPGMFFAKRYAALTGRKVLLVPAAWGGTALVSPSPTWSPSGRDYLNAIDQANRAVTAAVAAIPGSRFVGILWIQGESDGQGLVTRAAYRTALQALIAGMRSGITGASNAWFVIGQMLPEAISIQGGTYSEIDAAHTEIGADGAYCTKVAIGTGFNNGDNLHYSAAGARLMGTTMGDGAITAASYAGAAQPAQVTGLTVGTIAATSVDLSWSAVSGARYYEIQSSPAGAGSWTTFGTTPTTTSVTVTGLTASTAYDFRVRAANYGPTPTGAYSSSVSATTAVGGPVDAFPRLTSLVNVTESGNGTTGWLYGTATGSAFQTHRAGISSLKMPAGVNGDIRLTVNSPSSTNSVMLGLILANTNPDYSTGVNGYKFGILNHPTSGNYRVIVDGGVSSVIPTLPAVVAQNGDIMRLVRTAGGTVTAQVARAASPTTWVDVHVFVATSTADLWTAVAFANTTGATQTHGPLVGLGFA